LFSPSRTQDESRVAEKRGCGGNGTVIDNHGNHYSRYGQLQQAFIVISTKNETSKLGIRVLASVGAKHSDKKSMVSAIGYARMLRPYNLCLKLICNDYISGTDD